VIVHNPHPIDDIDLSPGQAHCLALWHAARTGGCLPPRDSFDMLSLRPALGWAMVVERGAAHDRITYRYRLVGTYIVERTGQDMTGRTVDDFPHAWQRTMLRQAYEAAAAYLGPVLSLRRYSIVETPGGDHTLLILPYRTESDPCGQFLVVMAPLDGRLPKHIPVFNDRPTGSVQQTIMPLPMAEDRTTAFGVPA